MNQVTEDAHQQDALTLRKLLADLKSAEELQELGSLFSRFFSTGPRDEMGRSHLAVPGTADFRDGRLFFLLSELQELNRKIREQEGP